MSWDQFQPNQDTNKFQLALTQEETSFYDQLYNHLDPNQKGTINGKESVNFFKNSGLPILQLKQIWIIASTNGENLNRQEFQVAMKLISYAQNDIEITEQSIIRKIPSPLPKFQGFEPQQQQPQLNQPQLNQPQLNQPQLNQPQLNLYQPPKSFSAQVSPAAQPLQTQFFQQDMTKSQYELPADILAKYESFYGGVDQQKKGYVSAEEAKGVLQKSQLQKEQLIQIWALCDSNNKGYLLKYELILAIHLVALVKKGIQLPTQLPDCLQQYYGQRQNSQNSSNPSSMPQQSPQTNLLLQSPQSTQQQSYQMEAQPNQMKQNDVQYNISNSNDMMGQYNNSSQDQQSYQQQQMEVNQLQQKIEEKQKSVQQNQNSFRNNEQQQLLQQVVDQKKEYLEFLNNLVNSQELIIQQQKNDIDRMQQQITDLDLQTQTKINTIQKQQQIIQDQGQEAVKLREQMMSKMQNQNQQPQNPLQSQQRSQSQGYDQQQPFLANLGPMNEINSLNQQYPQQSQSQNDQLTQQNLMQMNQTLQQMPYQMPQQNNSLNNQVPQNDQMKMMQQPNLYQQQANLPQKDQEDDDYANYRAMKQRVQSNKSQDNFPVKPVKTQAQQEEQLPW